MQSLAVVPSGAAVASEFTCTQTAQPAAVASDEGVGVMAPPLRCAAGHDLAPSIAIVCPSDDCENSFVAWPAWFSQTANRQLFVNALRSAALGAALALGHLGLQWPAAVVSLLLTLLFVSVLLREHPWAERRTLIGATFAVAAMSALRLPTAQGWGEVLVTTVIPVGLTLVCVRVAWRRQAAGRLAYFPVFSVVVAALAGLGLLEAISSLHGLTVPMALTALNLASWVEMGLKACASVLVGGVVVGGVLAGRARDLDPLSATHVRGPRLGFWAPRRIARQHTANVVPPPMRSVVRMLDTLAYVLAIAFRSITMQTCNAFVRAINRMLAGVLALFNAAATLIRRFGRRLAVVVTETLFLVREGYIVTRRAADLFVRFYLLPFAALLMLGWGILGVQDGLAGYVGNGNLGSLGMIGVSMLLIVVTASALAGLQTRTSLILTLQIVLRGLVEPAIGALLFFILLSVGLALSGNVLGGNPYTVGPVTIGAVLLVVGGFGLQLTLARRAGPAVGTTVEASRQSVIGRPVRVAPAVWSSTVLALLLGGLTLIAGTHA